MFRRTYPELEELIRRAREIYPQTGAVWHEQPKTWNWPNGATLRMRYLEREADVTRYQGHQYTWIGWDELTQWATAYAYKYLRGRLRSASPVATKRIRAAGNPGGVGHHWVKSYFVDPAPLGYVPTVDEDTGARRLFIPSKLEHNLILNKSDPGYRSRLKGLGSPQLVRALLEGDWSVIEGAFFPEWNEKHVIPPFAVPDGWLRFRSADWGSAAPFVIQWWAVVGDDGYQAGVQGDLARSRADGLSVDGRWLPSGSLVCYREWYGGSEPNVGIKLPAEVVADGIKQREMVDGEIRYGVLDPSAFASDGGPSIAERMASRGVHFRRADNDRVPQRGALGGWDALRSRLRDTDGRPAIYFFSTCVNTIRTIPTLQHDPDRPEDVLKKGDDHAGDAARYACMSRPWIARVVAEQPKPTDLAFEVKDGKLVSNMSVMDIVQQRMRKKRLEGWR